MLVRKVLGFPSLVFLVVAVIVFIIRRKWRQSVERNEEIKRLVVSASEELARAEYEAREAYYYTVTAAPSARVSVSPSTSDSVPLSSPLKPQYQCAVCFSPTTTRCAKCKAVRYCSGKCQIVHWRQGHKYECRPYVAASPNNDVGGSPFTQGDHQVHSDGFDSEAQQTPTPAARFPENSHQKDDLRAESMSHQQDIDSSFETVASGQQTLASPARKSTDKKSNVSDEDAQSGTSSSSGWTDNGSNESSISEPSTNSSGFWDGTIPNKRSSVDDHSDFTQGSFGEVPKANNSSNIVNECNVAKVVDGSGSTSLESKKLNNDSVDRSKEMVNGGSKSRKPPTSASGMLNHRDADSKPKDDESFGGSNDVFRNKSAAPISVKVDDVIHKVTEISPSVRSGSKISKSKVVDQVKPSKLSHQESLEGGNETTQRYSFKGFFPYEMFVKLYNSKKVELRPCGLKNIGNSCYANAVLQCLMYTPPLTAYLLEGLHSKSCGKRGWCFTCELEGLVMKAKNGSSPLSPVRILTHVENMGSNLGQGKEEDAHEFLRYVIDALQAVCIKEAGTNGLNSFEEETTLVGLTFGGYLRSRINCMKCGGKSERHERMMDLTVEIEGEIRTLEEALDKFTCTEILDGENKYKCGRCKSYEKAKKKLTLLEAPNVLTIALKRFQSGKFGKLNKPIRFPEILDMAPYVSGTSDKSPIYRLYGVVVHLDTMNAAFSGHYVCYVKNVQNRWFKFDDSAVKEVDLQHVLTKGAYMLLYARCSPRAPRSIRSSLIHHNDPRKHKAPPSFMSRPHCTTETWDACNYHPTSNPQIRHRTLEEESSSSSDNSGFFSESCSCSTDSTHRDSTAIDDHIYWEREYNNNISRNMNVNSSDSDTSSTSSFPSPLYSRLSHLYASIDETKECRNMLDCSCNSCSKVTNLDRLGSKPGVTLRRSTARGKSD